MKRLLLCMLVLACATRLMAAPNDPKAVAASFYEWYMTHAKKMPNALAEQKPHFTDELYGKVMHAYTAGDIDCDPFINAQMYAQHYMIGRVDVQGTRARVNVGIQIERGGNTNVTLLMVENPQHEWKIADIVYPAQGDVKSWTLLEQLKK